jgi:hypothetical protein
MSTLINLAVYIDGRLSGEPNVGENNANSILVQTTFATPVLVQTTLILVMFLGASRPSVPLPACGFYLTHYMPSNCGNSGTIKGDHRGRVEFVGLMAIIQVISLVIYTGSIFGTSVESRDNEAEVN